MSPFPTINACLNALSFVFLMTGFVMIRQKKVEWHRFFMLCATVTSAVFLSCYLYYHFNHGRTTYTGVGPIRTAYLGILLTHTILAMAVPPLVIRTLYLAWRESWEKHKFIARITFPIWVYVSLTGVIVYWMLYR